MDLTPSICRFERAMVSKREGKCAFCGSATHAGTDYAVLHNGWLGVCATCAASTATQARQLLIALQREAAGVDAAVLTEANGYAHPATAAVIDGTNTDEQTAAAVVTGLLGAVAVLRTHKPVVRSNRYDGKCATCKQGVLANTGRIEKDKVDGKWLTFHLDGQCPTPGVAFEAVAPTTVVPEGRYALRSDDGEVKFYRVEHGSPKGKWAGFVFLSAQASDDLYPIRNKDSRQAILDAIAVDPQAALALYGIELGVCGRCGKTLTSEYRTLGIGPVCINKAW